MNKQDTGHKEVLINGKTIVEHLMPTLKDECRYYGVALPNDEQIAVVISALRMHHTMVHASNYDRSELHKPDQVTDFYPIQSSIGRYFRDTSSEILREHKYKESL